MKCMLCSREFEGQIGLSSHVKQTHKFTHEMYKEYYDKYVLKSGTDLTCPVCKIHQRKFYSFKEGYCKTCIGQIDNNGNKLNCRAIWANRDREKRKLIALRIIKEMKNTPSKEDPTKSVFEMKQLKTNKTMLQILEDGTTRFNIVGKKVQHHHNSIDPATGKKFSELQSEKAAITRTTTILPDGRTLGQHSAKKAADKVSSIIMEDGRTKKEHMTKKGIQTRYDTILPNGLNVWQDTARKARITMIERGSIKYYGYSKISKIVFDKLVEECNLDLKNCLYAKNEYQVITEGLEKNSVYRIDFTYMKDNKPFIFIEFNGNQFHIRESELEKRKDELSMFDEKFGDIFEKDQKKKQYILTKFPGCHYFEIWEDTIEEDCQRIYEFLKGI